MCGYRVNKHLIVLNLCSVSINKILVTGFITVLIECLEENIRKHIDCERPSSQKQINRVQNSRTETCKWKLQFLLLLVVCTNLALNYIE